MKTRFPGKDLKYTREFTLVFTVLEEACAFTDTLGTARVFIQNVWCMYLSSAAVK